MAYGTVTGCGVALYWATGRVLLQRSRMAANQEETVQVMNEKPLNATRLAA
jgi:hypothetical protein